MIFRVIFTALASITFLTINSIAQQTIIDTISHDDIMRDYILYIPDSYTGEEEVPLVINFHGLSSSAAQQMFYGDFRPIADTAGFIVVHPQGTDYQGISHWNVGGFTSGSLTDDIGFTSALIDSLSAEYLIDENRVYATGMSNGGYMSFLLACQLSDRIAAIASVTGSMTPSTLNECAPERTMPVMQIHGTMDPTVPYEGAFFSIPIDNVLEYWRDFNECYEIPAIDGVPDINPDDGCTADHITYDHPFLGSLVEHYKIYGGEHTWPGTVFNIGVTNYDFNASEKIWQFFNRFDLNGLISDTKESLDNTSNNKQVILFPNPAKDFIRIQSTSPTHGKFRIFNVLGELMQSGSADGLDNEIDISTLPEGNYVLKVGDFTIRFSKFEK